VILASEFSRDMLIEGKPGSNASDQATEKVDVMQDIKHYGQHRHFTGGSCVMLWGGGVKKGLLYGKSAPERPFMAIENPITVTDLHATIFTAMGVSPKTAFDVEQRPFYATSDGLGKPVMELF
jgi:hypothetical protein